MTKELLFDAMGDIRDSYILTVAEQIETTGDKPSRSLRTIRTVFLSVAVLALLSFTVIAAEFWDFGRRLIRSETAPPYSRVLPQTYLSLGGSEESPESVAVAEWLTFRDSYINQKSEEADSQWKDPEFSFTAGNNDAMSSCQLYGAWDETMYDTLLAIAQKYDLSLHTSADPLPRGKMRDGLCIYENDAFVAEGYTPLQHKYCYYLVRRETSGTMPCETVNLYHADEYREETYVNAGKDVVHLAIPEGSGMGFIFFDDGNTFLSVEITLRPTVSDDWPELLKAIADTLDFDALCGLDATDAVRQLQPVNTKDTSTSPLESNTPANIDTINAPILRMQPMTINLEQAKLAAKALFGNSPMYEYTNENTKQEIKALIAAWEYGITDEAIRKSYGENISDDSLAQIRNDRQKILDYYIGIYPYARENTKPEECLWTFWPSGHYDIQGHDYRNTDIGYTGELPYGASYELQLTSSINGLPYRFSVTNREASDYRYHALSVYLHYSDREEEDVFLRTMDITTNPITQTEIDSVEKQMKELIAAMGLGEFDLSAETYCRNIGSMSDEVLGDIIKFTGVPCYAGLPVRDYENMGEHISIPGLSNYYPEKLTIHCSRAGELIWLQWDSPMEVVEVVEENCTPMPHEDIETLAWPDGKPSNACEYPCTAYMGDITYTRIRENNTYFLLIPTQH